MAGERANARLETFCDGVFAIALTLLVLDLRPPATEVVRGSADLWRALGRLLPSFAAFLLSFLIILISWVNHHALMKLVDKSSARFIYANGFLMLTVVLVPFPTALLAEYGFTEAASPAVVTYALVNFLQGVAWVLVASSALRDPPLTKSAAAAAEMAKGLRKGISASVVYFAFAIVAIRYPLMIAAAISVLYTFWLIFGIRAPAGD